MLFFVLVAASAPLVFGYSCQPQDDETDIYPYILKDLRQLNLRQEGETPEDVPSTSVCYDDLGCFDSNGTFKHLKQLPDTPENIATQFLLYTRKNSHRPQIIDYTKPETLDRSNFNPKLPVKFIVHGFGGKKNLTWIWNMKNAFMAKYDLNVIAVDWSKGAAVPHYINAAVNAELVGAQIAALYFVMKDKFGITEDKLHVIGFSLGAHVSGFVGKRMRSLRGTKPGRITGLDPASPLYEDYGGTVHLFRDDADFVDVIHTNADLLIYGGVGIGEAIGHADYYPNGGIRQPGCSSTLKGAFLDLIMKGKRDRVCNHERAVHLFTESILEQNPCKFASFPCSDFKEFSAGKCFPCATEHCGMMGYQALGTGVHYLMTDEKTPYCADNAVLSIEFSKKNEKKSYGSIVLILISADGIEKHNVTVTKSDEKLLPGEVKKFALALNQKMQSIKEIQVVYVKNGGWFFKGTEQFILGFIKLVDTTESVLFQSCSDQVMKDNTIVHIPKSDTNC